MKNYLKHIITIFTLALCVAPSTYAQDATTLPPAALDSSHAILLQSNTVYSGLRITNPHGRCIDIIQSSNIVLKDSIIGPCKEEGVRINQSSNITVRDSIIHDVASGVAAFHTTGNIKIINNKISNINTLREGPRGTEHGHHIQFASVSGVGNLIQSNVGENVVGLSDPAEGINIFRSNGTASNPIEVLNNSLRGGGYEPNSQASGYATGAGILLGDGGGSHLHAKNNVAVSTGVHGISIAGGQHNKLINNAVYSARTPITYAGIHVFLFQNPILPKVSCLGHEVRGNKVNWTNHWGTKVTGMVTKNCGTVAGWENNNTVATLNENILPAQLIEPVLKVHYGFDDSTEDKSGNAIHANATNATYNSSGIGKALYLNGQSSSVKIPSSEFLRFSPFTVSTWVRPETLAGTRGIAQSQNGDGFKTGWRIEANNTALRARITTRDYSRKLDNVRPVISTDVSCDGLVAATWNYIVITYDGQNLQCYLNGALGDSRPATGLIVYDSKPSGMKVGESAGLSGYIGLIDEFKFFRGSLSSVQVRNTYESTSKTILNTNPKKGSDGASQPSAPILKVGGA